MLTLEQKQMLYIKSSALREYNNNQIKEVSEKGILFTDGRYLDFEKCKDYFPCEAPYDRKYIGARFPHSFWQFFDENDSVVVLCNDKDDYFTILTNIGILNSFDLS